MTESPTADSLQPPMVVGPEHLDERDVDAVLNGAAVARVDQAVYDLTGAGVVTCVQGVLTNDVEAPGPDSLVFGAVLTPKGKIVADLWVTRRSDRMTLVAPPEARAGLEKIFMRYFPPRLARVSDVTAERCLFRLTGAKVLGRAAMAGFTLPHPGRAADAMLGDVECEVTRPSGAAPFSVQILVPRDGAEKVGVTLGRFGFTETPPLALELARIVAGWPKLGTEIDAKTLPQEVRFDDIDGVSYSKGCYTGQETVARLHFRGHTNRYLTGLVWEKRPAPAESSAIVRGDRPVGRVTAVAWIPRLETFIGLGLVRREVQIGDEVTAAGAPAITSLLPLSVGA